MSMPPDRKQGPAHYTGLEIQPWDADHPTVKPIALMRWLLTLVTPPGGVVLDPFMGSGSTGVAAADLGVRFVGIERERKYFDIARNRIQREFDGEVD